MTAFPFLDLPPEIREKIYHQICVSPTPIPLSPPHHQHSQAEDDDDEPRYPTFPHTLHLTCTQIYTEIRPLFFTLNKFTLTLTRHNDFLTHTIFHPSFHDNLLQIRALTLIIWRWGSKEFFLKSVVPVLEDCILNGRLRILRVVVKEQFLRGLGGGAKGEGENWKALRRVLGDEYLEVGRLLSGLIEVERDGIEVPESLEEEGSKDVTELLWDGEIRSRRR